MITSTPEALSLDLDLSPTEQAVLLAEITPFAARLGDPALRERYAELLAAAEAGHIPAALTGLVEALAELLLRTQRVRRQHGPEAERALTGLYGRTPRGQAIARSVVEVNTALTALLGQPLQALSFAPVPGGQRLHLVTDQGHLELVIDQTGVHLDRVELGRIH